MVDVNVEITVEDSPVENALDLYYSHLYGLLSPETDQKIALNSSLVTFDILPDAPMYTEFVFRAFADRTVSLSPTDFDPVRLGVANTNDRYSKFYLDLLRHATFDLDVSLSQESLDKIDNLERENKVTRKELQQFTNDMFQQWRDHAETNNITEDDPYYLDKQTAFFNVNNFAEQITLFKEMISENIQKIYMIRWKQYPDSESRQLASLLKHGTLDQYLMPRPKNPMLEEINDYDPIKLGQAWIYGNLNYFEESVEILPSGWLPRFLENVGKRNFRIQKGKTAAHNHDSSWSASGSARKWFFFKASANASYEKHVRESVNSTAEIEIKFENIAEYWVNRGPWFASNIFDYERVKEVLSSNPILAARLGYAISSVVLGRGMSITYKFSKESSFKEWSKFESSASGSFSAFGLNIPMASGSHESHRMDSKTSDDNKSVTFFDDPNHVRLLGFRVDKMFDGADEFVEASVPYLDNTIALGGSSDTIALFNKGTFDIEKIKADLIADATKKLRNSG